MIDGIFVAVFGHEVLLGDICNVGGAFRPERSPYIAYVSEQNLVPEDRDEDPIDHPELDEFFERVEDGRFILRQKSN